MLSSILNRLRLAMETRRNPAAPAESRHTFDAHLTRYFGENYVVMHEKQSPVVHVDVYVVKPTTERPFYTLMTAGMSDRAMEVPAGMEDVALAEVCLCLPPNWPLLNDQRWDREEHYWPARLLKAIARYPHLTNGWIAWGHTVENPKPYDPAGRFIGALLTAPALLPLGAEEVALEDGRVVRYLAVVPLTENELRLAREQDAEALDELLTRGGVTELIDPARPSQVS